MTRADRDALAGYFRATLAGLLEQGAIDDEFRAPGCEDDDEPSMQVTFATTDGTEWAMQTGDNSYTGSCYSFEHWAVLTLDRESDCEALANHAANELYEMVCEAEEGGIVTHCYSFGECPDDVIRAACHAQCSGGYPMTIRSQGEWGAIAEAVNQGIDSHLEALTESSFNTSTGECLVHPDELHVLLRRLFESGDEEAWSLRSDILQSLDIEEV